MSQSDRVERILSVLMFTINNMISLMRKLRGCTGIIRDVGVKVEFRSLCELYQQLQRQQVAVDVAHQSPGLGSSERRALRPPPRKPSRCAMRDRVQWSS